METPGKTTARPRDLHAPTKGRKFFPAKVFLSSSKSNSACHDPRPVFRDAFHDDVLPSVLRDRPVLEIKILDRKFVDRWVLFSEGDGL